MKRWSRSPFALQGTYVFERFRESPLACCAVPCYQRLLLRAYEYPRLGMSAVRGAQAPTDENCLLHSGRRPPVLKETKIKLGGQPITHRNQPNWAHHGHYPLSGFTSQPGTIRIYLMQLRRCSIGLCVCFCGGGPGRTQHAAARSSRRTKDRWSQIAKVGK
jgi:hypothetical protein